MFQDFPSPSHLIEVAEQFFSKAQHEDFPEVLRNPHRRWMVLESKWYMALFCLSPEAVSRVQEYQKKKWHPFPFLFTKSEEEMGGFVGGGYFSSNTSGGNYAFNVSRNKSFIIHNHRHTFVDSERMDQTYTVELAFVVGKESSDFGETLENVFRKLFELLKTVWVKYR